MVRFFAQFEHFFRLLTHEKLFQCVTLSQFLAAGHLSLEEVVYARQRSLLLLNSNQ